MSDFKSFRADNENFKLYTDGRSATQEILKRIVGDETESSAVIEAVLDIAMGRMVENLDSIRFLKVDAQKQQQEIEAISRGKPAI